MLVFLFINPTVPNFEATISTLRFGLSAKKVENRVMLNLYFCEIN